MQLPEISLPFSGFFSCACHFMLIHAFLLCVHFRKQIILLSCLAMEHLLLSDTFVYVLQNSINVMSVAWQDKSIIYCFLLCAMQIAPCNWHAHFKLVFLHWSGFCYNLRAVIEFPLGMALSCRVHF